MSFIIVKMYLQKSSTKNIDYSQLAMVQFVSVTSCYMQRLNVSITSVSKSLVTAIKDAHMRPQLLGDNVHDVICAVHKSPEKNFCNHF